MSLCSQGESAAAAAATEEEKPTEEVSAEELLQHAKLLRFSNRNLKVKVLFQN